MELPLEGLVSLCSCDGRATLLHHLTWEIATLPGPPSAWSLGVDSEGVVRVRDTTGQNDVVASHCFSATVLCDLEKESLHVLPSSGDLISFGDFLGANKPLDVRLRHLGIVCVTTRAWLFRRSQGGAFCFWSLPDLYAAADAPYGMSASQWYHSWWPWWAKRLGSLGLAALPHLRRATPTSQASQAAHDDKLESNYRVLPLYSLSTFALVALLPQWCSQPARGKIRSADQVAPSQWTQFATMLFDTHLRGSDRDFNLFLDLTVEVIPGLHPCGFHPVKVQVDAGGFMDLQPLRERPFAGPPLLEPFGDQVRQVGLLDLLKAWGSRKQFFFAYKQLAGYGGREGAIADRGRETVRPPSSCVGGWSRQPDS